METELSSSVKGCSSQPWSSIGLQPFEFLAAVVSREVENDGTIPAIWAILPLLEMRGELSNEFGEAAAEAVMHLDRLVALMACEILFLSAVENEKGQTLLNLSRNLGAKCADDLLSP
jgi:hypothetical protein